MDVYGYTSYPYNQSDELAKQAFAQQGLAVPFPNRGVPEPHVMPVPTGAPWNVQGVPWGMSSPPELVQFTAAGRASLNEREEFTAAGRALLNEREGIPSPAIHCKRKSLDVEPAIPAKQRITEEKMAAHLNGLHISSEYTPHSLASDDVMDINMEPSTSTAEKLKGHTIVLSEELKKLQDEPLLPAALIERLEKPHMSLVVWKPRDEILGTLKEEEKKEKEEYRIRNGVLVPNHQVADDVEM